ncbi:MAG: hypothetical protein NTX03_05240 [Bacteroidetes bacterium]|nr:hypothetical protein [Bacteroidota bacterium]
MARGTSFFSPITPKSSRKIGTGSKGDFFFDIVVNVLKVKAPFKGLEYLILLWALAKMGVYYSGWHIHHQPNYFYSKQKISGAPAKQLNTIMQLLFPCYKLLWWVG